VLPPHKGETTRSSPPAISHFAHLRRCIGVSLPPFQAFLEANRDDVYRFLVAAAGREEADDCFQETFLSALRAYPRVEPGSNLRAWVLRIAQRKAIDAHRARGRRAVPVASLPDGRDEREPGGAGLTSGDPDLWARVRALPEKQRLAVVHRTVLEMHYAELGELLDCSQEAARRSVHEGLKRLRKEIGNE
jgi:RNA polymerase sigma factor (sigma-70 family)